MFLKVKQISLKILIVTGCYFYTSVGFLRSLKLLLEKDVFEKFYLSNQYYFFV